MNNTPTILVVEDEVHLAELLSDYLKAANFEVQLIHHGDEALKWLEHNTPRAIILDLMLPGIDGIEICKRVRASSDLPILMTTARIEEIDRLLGLELGADDYICKPYSPREVVARVKTVLRRVNNTQQPTQEALVLIRDHCLAQVAGQKIELTGTETELLAFLMASPGRIFSRDQIMDNIYRDYRVVSERTIDSHVKKLRKKLLAATPNHDFIQSVYGVGYKFEPLIQEH